MTPLKQTRLALGLSAAWCAKHLAGEMSVKSYRAQENGLYAAHADVLQNMVDAEKSIKPLIDRSGVRSAKATEHRRA